MSDDYNEIEEVEEDEIYEEEIYEEEIYEEEDNECEEGEYTGKRYASPVKAIRAKCLDCSNQQINEVRLCPCTNCALYPYRFGKNPYSMRGKNMTDEQKQAMADRLKKARESKSV